MPYIGNEVGNRFVASKAASVYSGDGSTTAFTLEHAVGSDEDILVSVDGVIQEPSVAYAVSSGTTLTFTAAPSSNSGNNIFVYYLFRTVATVDHPSTSSLQATDATFTGAVTANAGVVVDNITIDGTEIDLSSGDLTIDVAGDIILDADGADIKLKDGGTQFGQLYKNGNDFRVESNVSDGDLVFTGNDGGSGVTALTLDMSDTGTAIFNNKVTIGGTDPQIRTDTSDGSDNKSLYIGGGGSGFDWNRGAFLSLGGNEAGGDFNIIAGNVSTGDIIFKTTATERMKIDANGHITKPTQPAFLAIPASTQTNIAVGTTTVVFGTEVYDQNGDFSSNTFTAPVTGKYFLGLSLYLQEVDVDATYVQVDIATSNRFYFDFQDLDYTGDRSYLPVNMGIVADMDANDTAFIRYSQSGGAAQTDINSDARFMGYLLG